MSFYIHFLLSYMCYLLLGIYIFDWFYVLPIVWFICLINFFVIENDYIFYEPTYNL